MKLELAPLVKLEKAIVYACQRCPNAFTSEEKFLEHVNKHERELADARWRHLQSAVVVLDRIKIFECERCLQRFTNVYDYKLHKIKHIQRDRLRPKYLVNDDNDPIAKPYKCPDCDARYVAESTLIAHSVLHAPFPHICECGIGYYSHIDLKNHKTLMHNTEPDKNPNETEPMAILKTDCDSDESKPKIIKTKLGMGPKLKAAVVYKSTKKNKTKKKREKLNNLKILKNENNTHVCTYCGKSLASKRGLIVHIRTHTGEKPYSCRVCKKSFTQCSALNVHMIRHTGKKDFACSFCEKTFVAKSALQLHERTHTGEKPYHCTYCEKKFSDPSAFNRHKRTHTGDKPYGCPYCSKFFSDSSALYVHRKRHEGNYAFSCDICPKRFITQSDLRNHLSKHSNKKPFECQYCYKDFSLVIYLQSHIKLMHSNLAKKFQCDVCSKKFKTKYGLKIHFFATHVKTITCECEECGRPFSSKNNLERHRMNVHRRIKQLECDDCGQKLASKSDLLKHVRGKHPAARCDRCPLGFYCNSDLEKHRLKGCITCETCGKTFASERHKRHHSESHKTGKRYHCNDCPKQFRAKSTMVAHQLTEHGGKKIHECDHCGETFAAKRNIITHIMDKHIEILYCNVCSKKFYSNYEFNKHKRAGGCSKKKTICDICHKEVVSYSSHLISHSNHYYECDHCGSKVKSKSSLRRHMFMYHI